MIIVTGAAGFIGSNLILGLNKLGYKNIIAVDNLTDGTKFKNLVDCEIEDYLDKTVFLRLVLEEEDFLEHLIAVFHMGACSATTEWDGKFMMENNYEYSKILLHHCLEHEIPYIYASSAATYGNNTIFVEDKKNEKPINVYGYSKFIFDQHVRKFLADSDSQIVGLRFFNVYGPRENHKGSMASVVFHQYNQLKTGDEVKLFAGCDGYSDGEQRRDFIYVSDVVDTALWFLENRDKSGVFNVGTGRSQPFNDVANAVIKAVGRGKIKYIPFPEHLQGHYQSFTEADISALRAAGYKKSFKTVDEGVAEYVAWLQTQA